MNKLSTLLLLGPLLLADDPARVAVPAEAEQVAKKYFEERWKPSLAEHYGVADGEIPHARLVVPFQELILRGDAATQFLMSDGPDPRPYAVIKRYTFPIMVGNSHLGSIIVQYNRDENGDKFDDSAGDYFVFGLSAKGNGVDENAVRLRAGAAPGSTVTWVQILEADVLPRFIVQLPDGTELSAPEGEVLIPLSEDGKRMKQEIRSGGLSWGVQGSELKTGPSHSPISVVDMQTALPRVTPSQAKEIASRIGGFSGISQSPARLVRYKDQTPFGPPASGTGWLCYNDVQVSRDDNSARIPLSVLVDGTTGSVVAAYTDPAESWVLTADPSFDPQETASGDGWVMGSTIPDSLRSNAAEAITAVWRSDGIDPRQAGQIVVRPRWISAKFPARKVGGKYVPVRPTEKVWLVQVCGTRLFSGGHVHLYCSGMVLQYRDGSLEFARAFYVP